MSEQKWISVKERLPGKWESYLVTIATCVIVFFIADALIDEAKRGL